MPPQAESVAGRVKESLRFWTIVALICSIVFFGAYILGKDWLGARLHDMEIRHGAPEISPEASLQQSTSDEDADQGPPEKAVIVIEEREPSGRERREVEREIAAREPQDGAQLHAAEEETRPEEPPEENAPEQPSDSPVPSGTGGYAVTAGSFADEGNARRVAAELTDQGYQPFLTTVESEGMTFQRVNVAVCRSRREAEKIQNTLKTQGYDSAVWAR